MRLLVNKNSFLIVTESIENTGLRKEFTVKILCDPCGLCGHSNKRLNV
jgi:hypothetical protein